MPEDRQNMDIVQFTKTRHPPPTWLTQVSQILHQLQFSRGLVFRPSEKIHQDTQS